MRRLLRFLYAITFVVLAPLLLLIAAAGLAFCDLFALLRRRRSVPPSKKISAHAASVVIPNWNGRDLLEKYLPSVLAALDGNASNEVIVVDNGSTDGSVEFVTQHFPSVNLIALPKNLGFGGGSNVGFRAARNDIVVLLNSDMRVHQEFLAPLLEGFFDEKVFAVSCQIFFSDPNKRREETGLTQGTWQHGSLRVRHRIDEAITDLYPCFYGGGGSCAFDRRKFLELGGFDALLAPFYLEDTDLGYLAWKRGWKVLYQPRSVVFHEHRGTIGKRFNDAQIRAVLKKNFLLFTWKNIHEWRRLSSHFFWTYTGAVLSGFFGDSPERASMAGVGRAFLQLPQAIRSRWRALSLAQVNDTEAFRRPLGGYFRDRFHGGEAAPARPRVLFVSPYPIYPPVHGGAVFMYQTLRALVDLCDVHLIALLDYPHERREHEGLERSCMSAEFLVRMEGALRQFGSMLPHAIREFSNPDLEWLIHRQIYLHRIDVIQLEYLVLGQYAGSFRRLACFLFDHDVYFQSIARQLKGMPLSQRTAAAFEYLRALRYELRILPALDRVQVCSRDNASYLLSFLPELSGRIDDDLRAAVDISRYTFQPDGREPRTMLFTGNFRHLPNVEALRWFVLEVLPKVIAGEPRARLVVVGPEAPPPHGLPGFNDAIEIRGFVDDIREPLSRYAVFVCPVLSGSGVRVKLLEAFACGIPAVSTPLGAEGLATEDGEVCRLADTDSEFADRILHLFTHPEDAFQIAYRARREVERRDTRVTTARLVETYRKVLAGKRGEPVEARVSVSPSSSAD